jgi:hypothetical protein
MFLSPIRNAVLFRELSMNRPTGILFAGLVISGAAYAQDWQTYSYPNPGFAIQFPAVPQLQTSKFRNAAGLTLPVTRYVVRQDGAHYTLSVVNYSSTNADALSIIGEAARSFSAKGKVNSNTGTRVDGTSGRQLTVTESDGSRSDIAIFFVNHHLYTAVGQALPPNPLERSADTARFQHSLRFLGDDSALRRLFGAGDRTSSNTAASTITPGSGSASGAAAGTGGAGAGAGGNAGTFKTVANQRADAACAGKSAGDLVQLDTPTGPVPATCTLTARPTPPAGGTPDGSAGVPTR